MRAVNTLPRRESQSSPRSDLAAHAALRTAIDARLVLLQVDTVETIAVIAVAAGEPAAASRLLAATNAERDRRGYLGRTLSAASMSNIAELQADQESAWTEGSALTLSEAIDLAERSAFGVGAGG